MSGTGIILISFGGPEKLEQVAPFMTRLTGRPLPAEAVERVVERYRRIGGGSPLPRIAREQAAALQKRLTGQMMPVVGSGVHTVDEAPAIPELGRAGHAIPERLVVRAAFKYADPSIADVVCELAQAGYERVIGVSLSAHYTRIGVGAYFAELRAASQKHGLTAVAADLYYAEPHFLDGLAAGLRRALAALSDSRGACLVFSAHSLPMEEVESGDPYVTQLQATVDGLLARVPGYEWRIAYQSRGSASGRWLEPTVEATLQELAQQGRRRVVLMPIGFTADHVETLYDLDIVAAGRAKELGLEFVRAGTLNTAPPFIETLASVVRPHLETMVL